MKIPTKLVTAAKIVTAAFALALTVATPAAQSALAADDSGKPPASTTPVPHPPTGPLRHAAPDLQPFLQSTSPLDSSKHFSMWFGVKNIGLAPSKPMLVYTYCVYDDTDLTNPYMPIDLDPDVIAAAPVFMLQPLAQKAQHSGMKIECGPRNGKAASYGRAVVVSEDDSNAGNNHVEGPPVD